MMIAGSFAEMKCFFRLVRFVARKISQFQLDLPKRRAYVPPPGISRGARQLLLLAHGCIEDLSRPRRAGDTFRDPDTPTTCLVQQWSPPGMDLPLSQREEAGSAWKYGITIEQGGQSQVTLNSILGRDCLPQAMMDVWIQTTFGADGSGQMMIQAGAKVAATKLDLDRMALTTASMWKDIGKEVDPAKLPIVVKSISLDDKRSPRLALYGICRLEEALVACHLHLLRISKGFKSDFRQILLATASTEEEEPKRSGCEQSSDAAQGQASDIAVHRALGRNSRELVALGQDLAKMFGCISDFLETNEGLKELLTAGNITRFHRPGVNGHPRWPSYIGAIAVVPPQNMKQDHPGKHYGGFGEELFGCLQMDSQGVVNDRWGPAHFDEYMDLIGAPVLRIAGSDSWMEDTKVADFGVSIDGTMDRMSRVVDLLAVRKEKGLRRQLLQIGFQEEIPKAHHDHIQQVSKSMLTAFHSEAGSSRKAGTISRLDAASHTDGRKKFNRGDVHRIISNMYSKATSMVQAASRSEDYAYWLLSEALSDVWKLSYMISYMLCFHNSRKCLPICYNQRLSISLSVRPSFSPPTS